MQMFSSAYFLLFQRKLGLTFQENLWQSQIVVGDLPLYPLIILLDSNMKFSSQVPLVSCAIPAVLVFLTQLYQENLPFRSQILHKIHNSPPSFVFHSLVGLILSFFLMSRSYSIVADVFTFGNSVLKPTITGNPKNMYSFSFSSYATEPSWLWPPEQLLRLLLKLWFLFSTHRLPSARTTSRTTNCSNVVFPLVLLTFLEP